MPRICEVEGCDRPHRRNGFCVLHSNRFTKYGDPLALKRTPNGEPQRFIYEVAVPYEDDDCLIWLTEDDIPAIRKLFGVVPQSEIARRYGVTDKAIEAVRKGRTWQWVP